MNDYKVAYFIPTYSSPRLAETISTVPQGATLEVVNTKERGWSLSKAWNYAAEEFLYNDTFDCVCIMNDDIRLNPDTGELLAFGLLEGQFNPTQPTLGGNPDGKLLLVSGYNLNPIPHGGDPDVGCRWGIGAPTYSLFVVGHRYFEEVGPFDENFPVYFEDNDSHRRIRLAGYEAAQWAPFWHHTSSTMTDDPVRRDEVQRPGGIFQQSQSYFIQKWGGMPDTPGLYPYPFNDPDRAWVPTANPFGQ